MATVVQCAANSAADRALRQKFQLRGAYSLAGGRSSQLAAYFRLSPTIVALPLAAGRTYALEQKLPLITNREHVPIELEAKYTPRPYQEEAMEELKEHLTAESPGLLAVLPPAWGKTLFGSVALAQVGLRTLILFDLAALCPSWTKVLRLVLPGARVWVVGETAVDLEADVILCMVTRIGHVPSAILRTVGFLIVDEAHRFCTGNRVDLLLRLPVARTLLLSGTPDRADGMNAFLDLLTGGKTIERPVPPYVVYKVNTGCQYPIRKKEMFIKATGRYQQVNDFTEYVKDVAKDEKRRTLIVDLVGRTLADRKIIILCRSVSNCKLLHTALVAAGISADWMAEGRKKYTDSRVLLGTGSKIGTGFDEANACEGFGGEVSSTLIIADTIKDSSAMLQWIGRVLRSDHPEVWQLVDEHPIAEKHWKENLKMHVELNQTVHECDYPRDFSEWLDEAVQAEITAAVGPLLPRDLVGYVMDAV